MGRARRNGALHPPKTDPRRRYYDFHDELVTCIARHPGGDDDDGVLVASAQMSSAQCGAHVRVWDSDTNETVAVLSGGIERSVCLMAFSPDGTRLASVDDGANHTVSVWARPAPFASRSVRRALLTPQVNPGSLYRCGRSS